MESHLLMCEFMSGSVCLCFFSVATQEKAVLKLPSTLFIIMARCRLLYGAVSMLHACTTFLLFSTCVPIKQPLCLFSLTQGVIAAL